MFINSLYELWALGDLPSDVEKYIERYIEIQVLCIAHSSLIVFKLAQLNTILSHAYTASSGSFATSWTGPQDPHVDPYSLVTALQVLNAAIGMARSRRYVPVHFHVWPANLPL